MLVSMRVSLLSALFAALLFSACGDDSSSAGAGPGGSDNSGGAGNAGGTGGSGASGAGSSGGGGAAPLICGPSGAGPHWVLETEPLSFEISCSNGADVSTLGFELAGLPAGATYDEASKTVSFTPGLDQAAVYPISITLVVDGTPTDEVGAVKIGVADKWDDPANVLVTDKLAYPEEYGLPVLFLDNAPTTEEYTPATITYGAHVYAGGEAKLRGAASLNYPKNSYTLKFTKEDKFGDPSKDFEEKRKVVLISTFDDNSYVRQRLAYDLWNAIDPQHLQIDTYSAVVFLNGEYFGLYTIADHVDGFLMEDHGLNQEGNLYKAINHDANFDTTSIQNGGAPKQTLHDGYTKKEGLPLEGELGAFDDLEELVNFVATSDDATFLTELDQRIDRRDYENWFIFATFILADDSAGKNSYHFHDPLDPASRWRYAPWDFNASFGQTWTTHREGASDLQEYVNRNRLFERFLAAPSIADPMKARYATLLTNTLSAETVNALVDAYATEIYTSAKRDEAKWVTEMQNFPWWSDRTDFNDHEGELAYVKAWIEERATFQTSVYP